MEQPTPPSSAATPPVERHHHSFPSNVGPDSASPYSASSPPSQTAPTSLFTPVPSRDDTQQTHNSASSPTPSSSAVPPKLESPSESDRASMGRFQATNAASTKSTPRSVTGLATMEIGEAEHAVEPIASGQGTHSQPKYYYDDEDSEEYESFDSDREVKSPERETKPTPPVAKKTVPDPDYMLDDDDEESEQDLGLDDSDYCEEPESDSADEYVEDEDDEDFVLAPKKKRKKPAPRTKKNKKEGAPKKKAKRVLSSSEDDFEDEDLSEDELVMDTGSEDAHDDAMENEDEAEFEEDVADDPDEQIEAVVQEEEEEDEEEYVETRGPLYSQESVPVGDIVEFACVISFFRTFQDVLNIPLFSPQELEEAIRFSKNSTLFEDVVSRLLFLMLNRKEPFKAGGWCSCLSRILKERKGDFVGFADPSHDDRDTYQLLIEEQETPDEHPLKAVSADIHGMSSYAKVLILSNLCDWCASESLDIINYSKRQRSTKLRAVPLGRDKNNSVYWYFAENSDVASCSIYRQDVNEEENTVTWNIETDSLMELEAMVEAAPPRHEDKGKYAICKTIREDILPIEQDRAKGEFRRQQRMERQARGLGISERNIIEFAAPRKRRAAAKKVRYTFSDDEGGVCEDGDENEYEDDRARRSGRAATLGSSRSHRASRHSF